MRTTDDKAAEDGGQKIIIRQRATMKPVRAVGLHVLLAVAVTFIVSPVLCFLPSSSSASSSRAGLHRKKSSSGGGSLVSSFPLPVLSGSTVAKMSDGGQQEGAAAGTCEKAAQGASCVPCSSMDPSHLLGKAEIERKLSSELPLWQLVSAAADDQHDHIRRKFTAKNFQCALDCVNAMGAIAEREGHHPDFHITSYRDVEVVIYTHKLDGVTGADLALATMFDREVKCEYSPKWLRDHPEAQGTAK